MSWVKTYQPDSKECHRQFMAYQGTLKNEREKIVKSSQRKIRLDKTGNLS